jgi:hypothetical protein
MSINDNDDFEFDSAGQPEESFHIELDLYETGDYSNLLVIPCNDNYIVVSNNEHLCTMVKTCDEPECWEQTEGSLDDDMVEKLGIAISGYISQL